MAFRKNMVACIKSSGKILREIDNDVQIPFGSEYSILLKNLNSKKAVVNIDIDGESVINGLIVHANDSVELERFENRANKFKFIEKTERISAHRGDRPDDGIIRIEFRYEKDLRGIPSWTFEHKPTWPFNPWEKDFPWKFGSSCFRGEPQVTCNSSGITVPGNESQQTFKLGNARELEENSKVIVIILKGKTSNGIINEPLTVKTKHECPTCGRTCKSSMKFCPECGTNIQS